MAELPYVYSYGKIRYLFEKIKEASAPPKFTQDFISTSLGFTSSSDRAFPNLLKRLGFIDGSNVPTEAYHHFRDDTRSKQVMAQQIRLGYNDLFKVNEYAYKLSKGELIAKVKQLTGLGENDNVLGAIVGTFMGLRDLADFETIVSGVSPKRVDKKVAETEPESRAEGTLKLGMSYTIVLNLPATTDIAVFNAIFKSLKENILKE